jgi:hypothetical protein
VKDQYVGDINDYRKYGLLRGLLKAGLSLTVCWMRTDRDDCRDGGKVQYLENDRYAQYDADLYERLRMIVRINRVRNISAIEQTSILPSCRFHSELVPPSEEKRRDYIDTALTIASRCDVIFFDPDNGLETRSCTRVCRTSHVAFFIIPQSKHVDRIDHGLWQVRDRWKDEIHVEL